MNKVNIGIIGCGKHFENFHLPSFKRLKKKICIQGIFDTDLRRAKYISKKYGIKKIFSSVNQQIINSIRYKKNIIVEKPFVLKKNQIDKIINLSKKTNLKIMCLQHSRFREETKSFYKFFQKNTKKFGKPFLIEAFANYSKGIPLQKNNSFTNVKLSGGGPLLDHGSHLLDLILYFFDFNTFKIKSSFFFKNFFKKNNIIYNVEEMATVNLLLDQKILLKFETSYLSHKEKDNYCINFYFENGYLNWPNLSYKLNNNYGFIKFKHKEKASDIQFSHFVDCVLNNKKPVIELKQTKKIVTLIEKLYNRATYIDNYG